MAVTKSIVVENERTKSLMWKFTVVNIIYIMFKHVWKMSYFL